MSAIKCQCKALAVPQAVFSQSRLCLGGCRLAAALDAVWAGQAKQLEHGQCLKATSSV